MMYLGDFPADQAIYFAWNTNDGDGASITRSGDGTVSVYKDNSDGSSFDVTQVTTGVTNDEDFDSLTGVHTCCITTTNAWYEIGHDYMVVLGASTIDTQTVNAVIAHFSIENRNMRGTDSAALATGVNLTQIGGVVQSLTDFKDMVDTGYDPTNHKIKSDLIYIHGTALTETDGQLAAAFKKLFDVATPLLVASTVMRGTDSAATSSALTTHDALLESVETDVGSILTGVGDLGSGVDVTKIHGVALTETVNGYLAAAFTKLFDVATPLLVASDVMVGTDSAALAADENPMMLASTTINTVYTQTDFSIADVVGDDDMFNHQTVTIDNGTGIVNVRKCIDYKAMSKRIYIDSAPIFNLVTGQVVKIFIATDTTKLALAATALTDATWTDDKAVHLDADISSRAPSSEYDTEMTHLDVDVSSRNATTPPTATEIRTEMEGVGTKITGIKDKTDNLPSGMAKNVAVTKFEAFMVLSSDHITAATGKTVTGIISKDGGSFAALTNSITEVSNGTYIIASGLTQDERNADVSTLIFTADDCDDLVITIISS